MTAAGAANGAVGVGVQLPQTTAATADGILAAARAAEAAGLHSVSVTERVIWPVEPVRTLDGSLGTAPAHQVTIFEPLETLAAVAAVTERVQLISAVIVVLYQSPVVLARRAATVDLLSGGRFRFGIGQGWMREEFAAAHVPVSRRGAGYAEHVAAMQALWGPDPVAFEGRVYQVPPSYYGPKPVRASGVPLYAGAQSEAGIRRAVSFAAGWLPVTAPGSTMHGTIDVLSAYRRVSDVLGRERLPVHLRAHAHVTETPLAGERIPLSGTIEQIADDVVRLQAHGVTDVCLNQTQRGVPFDEQLDAAVRLQEALR